jgi:hypothetical protein
MNIRLTIERQPIAARYPKEQPAHENQIKGLLAVRSIAVPGAIGQNAASTLACTGLAMGIFRKSASFPLFSATWRTRSD